MTAFLGCIADDYTGASDIASQLAEQGVKTVQLFGVPDVNMSVDFDAQAIIIGLKTRTEKVNKAVSQSLRALAFLEKTGCRRFYFKYCSTFDSTPEGNIGPVADALADRLKPGPVMFCPAFPKNGRTLYQGHLFVNGDLLSESSLATHPLTPMTDANLVRWLTQQTEKRVGLMNAATLDASIEEAIDKISSLTVDGCTRILADTLNEDHLSRLGELCADHKLVTGGSALAPALVKAWRQRGLMPGNTKEKINVPRLKGNAVILSGSCSDQSNRQVEAWRSHGGATYFLDPEQLMTSERAIDDAIYWIQQHLEKESVLVYATSPSDVVKKLQCQYGRETLGQKIEQAFVEIARHVTQQSAQTLIVAGGETSGAVVSGLNLNALTVGTTIAPGVPWMYRYGKRPLAIALKSGNFGADQFYREALHCLGVGGNHE